MGLGMGMWGMDWPLPTLGLGWNSAKGSGWKSGWARGWDLNLRKERR